MAPVASSLKVSGIRIAVPAGGPEPGQHADQRAEHAADESIDAGTAGLSAAANPDSRCCKRVTTRSQSPNRPIGSGTFSQW